MQNFHSKSSIRAKTIKEKLYSVQKNQVLILPRFFPR